MKTPPLTPPAPRLRCQRSGNNLGCFIPSERPMFEESSGKRLNSSTRPLNQSQGIHIGGIQRRAHLAGQGRVVS